MHVIYYVYTNHTIIHQCANLNNELIKVKNTRC